MGRRVIVGTCGFQKARRLHYRDLDAVEVQQTFYDPRDVDRLSLWRSEAPESFIFTMKAWMLVTHRYNKRLWRRLKEEPPGDYSSYGFFQDTQEVWWAWGKTLEAARALNAEVIVLQSPPSFKPSKENLAKLEAFLSKLDTRAGLAWEPRGDWWREPEVLRRISNEWGIAVVGDPLKSREPMGEIVYIRLHGMGGEVNYKYKYTDEDLRLLTAKMEEYDRRTYIMFNNIHAYEDAVRLKRLLGKE